MSIIHSETIGTLIRTPPFSVLEILWAIPIIAFHRVFYNLYTCIREYGNANPRSVIFGSSGSGKTSLLNLLLRKNPLSIIIALLLSSLLLYV